MITLRGSTLFGVALLIWVAWIILATDHVARIERTCQPILWAGNAITSIIALTVPAYQDKVDASFARLDYGCRYTVWRLVYEQDYLKHLEAQEMVQ